MQIRGPATSEERGGLLLFGDNRINASLRTVVSNLTYLNPGNLIFLDGERCASIKRMGLEGFTGGGLGKSTAEFVTSSS